MKSVIVVGVQWGDEGKGKVVDLLAERADYVVRSHGGNNAGHSILVKGEEFRFHLVPSGVLYPHVQGFITGGTVVDPQVLLAEIERLEGQGVSLQGRLHLSPYAHVIFPFHCLLDKLYEERKGAHAIGTTGRGIGPCYADKASRVGLRICDLIDRERFEAKLSSLLSLKNQELQLLFQQGPLLLEPLLEEYRGYAERLRPFVSAAEQRLAEGLRSLKKVLFEGAHGTLLDTNFGTYPFVTSSSTVASGVSCGAGIGPSRIDHTLGVVKAYTTRVGAGPLPSALTEGEQSLFADHKTAREIGTTTGRKRRMGWFDAPLVRHAVLLNGIDSLALTKLDILDPLEEIKICVGYRLRGEALLVVPPLVEDFLQVEPVYETMPGWRSSTRDARSYKDLPKGAARYVERLSELVGAPFSLISVGPERERTVVLQQLLKE